MDSKIVAGDVWKGNDDKLHHHTKPPPVKRSVWKWSCCSQFLMMVKSWNPWARRITNDFFEEGGQSDKKANGNSTYLCSMTQMYMQNQAPLSSGVHTSSTFFFGKWSTISFYKIRPYHNLCAFLFIDLLRVTRAAVLCGQLSTRCMS